MAKPSLTNITTTQTFQNWFDKTNEMVDIFRDEAITASAIGDTTTGNATLVGNFTATNIIGDTAVKSDRISAQTGGGVIDFTDPIEITGSSDQVVATFTYVADGPRVQFTDDLITWDVGFKDTSAAFIINTGVGSNKFELSTAGTLTVPNIDVLEGVDITTDLDVGGDMRVTGSLTINNLVANNVYAINELVTGYSGSDIRLKENLEIIPNALEKLSQVNGYTFNYIGKEERVTGVVAQEIEQVLPGIVFDAEHPDYDGPHKAVRYGHIVALLIEAVKELQGEVERLKDGSSK